MLKTHIAAHPSLTFKLVGLTFSTRVIHRGSFRFCDLCKNTSNALLCLHTCFCSAATQTNALRAQLSASYMAHILSRFLGSAQPSH